MNSSAIFLKSALAGAGALALAAPALAAPAVGLAGDKTLVWFDTGTPTETKVIEVSGVTKLMGIDLRPGDNKLYGVAADGALVVIDLASGAATEVAKLSQMLPEGASASVDFNPAADKLRVMGSDGTNLRVDPASGKVTVDGSLMYEAGDASAEMKPNIVATAYINSFGKPEKTAMYDIDASGMLIQQTKPNEGTLKTIGKLGVDTSGPVAFDVQTTADGANTAWLAAGGAIYKVNLETGVAEKTADGADKTLRDIAILPAM